MPNVVPAKCGALLDTIKIASYINSASMKRQIFTRDPSITVLPEIDIGIGYPLKSP